MTPIVVAVVIACVLLAGGLIYATIRQQQLQADCWDLSWLLESFEEELDACRAKGCCQCHRLIPWDEVICE